MLSNTTVPSSSIAGSFAIGFAWERHSTSVRLVRWIGQLRIGTRGNSYRRGRAPPVGSRLRRTSTTRMATTPTTRRRTCLVSVEVAIFAITVRELPARSAAGLRRAWVIARCTISDSRRMEIRTNWEARQNTSADCARRHRTRRVFAASITCRPNGRREGQTPSRRGV